MSGAALPGGGVGSPASARARRAWLPGATTSAPNQAARPLLAIELPLFIALAFLCMAQWARLVEPSSAGRLAAALAVVCLVAVILWALSFRARAACASCWRWRSRLPARSGRCIAAGLPLHLMAPGEWGELRHQLRGGMGGIEEAQLPYAGTDPWVRLTLVLGAPALVAVAAALAFWPRGQARATAGRRPRRAADRLRRRGDARQSGSRGVLGNRAAAAVGRLALGPRPRPGAPRPRRRGHARRRRPRPAGRRQAQRRGLVGLRELVVVRRPAVGDLRVEPHLRPARLAARRDDADDGETETPLYWKASVLDRFDGYRWERPVPGESNAAAELAARGTIPGSRARSPAPRLGRRRAVRARAR